MARGRVGGFGCLGMCKMVSESQGDIGDRTANLKVKTGRSLEEWFDVISGSKLGRHGEILAMLKHQYGVPHGSAMSIATIYCRQLAPGCGGTDPADAMFTGPKSVLRPIHDRLMEAIREVDPAAEIIPKKGYFSLRRSQQFGIVQPFGTQWIDLGLNLPGMQPQGRLESSNGFSVMVSHRVRICSVDEVDAQVADWLKSAFDCAK